MSDLNPAVADHHSETYPEFSGKIQDSYIEGYDPVSYSAPHSSLLRTSTSVSYTHLTLPTTLHECRSRWSPYH